MANDLTNLAAYSQEIGVDHRLTIEDLITSHRRLRQMSIDFNEERRLRLAEAWEYGRKTAEETALKNGWFSVERLRGMTLGELADLISEEEK